LATAVGGIPELLANGRGMVVPPRAPDALAQAMAQIATSAELRETIRAKALERIQRFYSLDAVTDEYLRLLGLPSQWNGSKSS
jgi:glycosyltransferase involved in cell wall biosynthesis